MYRKVLTFAFLGLSLGSLAHATVTWVFSSNPTQVANGVAYSTADGTVTPYGEQIDVTCHGTGCVTGVVQTTPTTYSGTSTLNGLFSTNTSHYNLGSGIAPFDPAQGGTPSDGFPNQLGINDNVQQDSSYYWSSGIHYLQYSNVLMLELGSNIAAGETLDFLLQGPTTDPITGEATAVNVYTATGASMPTNVYTGMSLLTGSPFGSIATNSTVPQFSLTKSAGIEWVAIEADCHYLLLDTITGHTPTVPEPRTYGILAIGLLGLVFAVRKRRAQAVQ